MPDPTKPNLHCYSYKAYIYCPNLEIMKKLAFTIIAGIAISLVFAFSGGEEYETLLIGAKAPKVNYEMESTQGEQLSLNSMKKENGTLVIFSCNTCPFVIAWEDRYPEIASWAEEANVGFGLINSNQAKREGDDSMDEMRRHAEEKGYPELNYLVDNNSELANAFGAKTTPHVFLFDKDWKLVYEGAIDDNHKSKEGIEQAYLKNALSNLAMGKEIDPNDTKALGCSIKRVKI